jgi:hypothetical protein
MRVPSAAAAHSNVSPATPVTLRPVVAAARVAIELLGDTGKIGLLLAALLDIYYIPPKDCCA